MMVHTRCCSLIMLLPAWLRYISAFCRFTLLQMGDLGSDWYVALCTECVSVDVSVHHFAETSIFTHCDWRKCARYLTEISFSGSCTVCNHLMLLFLQSRTFRLFFVLIIHLEVPPNLYCVCVRFVLSEADDFKEWCVIWEQNRSF